MYAQVLLEFNFENFSVDQVIGGQSFALSPALSGSHDMANNGVELFGAPNLKLSMTRFAGTTNFPELTFSTAVPMRLDTIEFLHIHNHNPGFPTFPSYDVDLELDTGSGYASVGTFLAESNGYDLDSFSGPGWLQPGTYHLRWIAQAIPDTNTEFFGLDNIRLLGALDSDDDGVTDELDVCPATFIAEAVPTAKLRTNRWALTDGDFSFDTTAPQGEGPGRSYTTADTAGCSCEQIIEIQGLGKGHTEHGCSISAMDDWIALLNPE